MKKALRTIGILFLLTALITALIPVSDAAAQTVAPEFQIEGTRLVKYDGTSEIVNIPSDVRTIGEEAFAGNNNIVKVNINDKCKSIGYGAFSNCRSLKTVNIGNDVTDIDSAAFSNDPVLSEVNIGSSVKNIGSAVFAGDESLFDLAISSENPHLLMDKGVLYNKDMTKIYCMLPSYSNGVFNMPNSVQEIKGYAFWGNRNIKNVALSSGLNSIPPYAFSNCTNLKQVVIPLPIRSIEKMAFENCANLSLVKCPESLTNIADNAFSGCPNVTFDAVEGSYAGNYAKNLKRTTTDEVEYEDVDAAPLVSIIGNPAGGAVTTDGTNSGGQTTGGTDAGAQATDGTNARDAQNPAPEGANPEDAQNPAPEGANPENATNPASAGDTASVNTQAKYSTGVINGSDVVEYSYYDAASMPTGMTIGSTIVAGGRALVFIDNKPNVLGMATTGVDLAPADKDSSNEASDENPDAGDHPVTDDNGQVMPPMDELYTPDPNEMDTEDTRSLKDILSDSASKGINFPKFTIAGDAIAKQAYYGNASMTEYEFPEGITSIGDFAFSRSGLTSVNIPEGVTDIGYGAFYHCDSLSDVTIPKTVNRISAAAFDNTPFLDNKSDTFVIAGDGVLLDYNGSDSVVTIPEGVKSIADGALKDHPGITAVNLPDSLEYIGEDAFRGCSNLSTLNRGDNVTEIGANAFKGTALSNVTIGPKVEKIGLGAFDLRSGTDTVTFTGDTIPQLVSGDGPERLSNTDDRSYAFGNMINAVIESGTRELSGTVLEPGSYGFKGVVRDSFGNTISDNSNGVYRASPDTGITIESVSSMVSPGNVSANIYGSENAYVLHISDSQNAKEKIGIAYGELYGGREPNNLIGFDLSLYDDSNTVEIRKLGKQTVDVTMPLPDGVSVSNLHVVSLDEDGQLEAVNYTLSEDGKSLTFKCCHFSPYGMYNYEDTADGLNMDGKTKIGKKDITPDTGDLNIHPKWFLVIGCVSLAIVLFLISRKTVSADIKKIG